MQRYPAPLCSTVYYKILHNTPLNPSFILFSCLNGSLLSRKTYCNWCSNSTTTTLWKGSQKFNPLQHERPPPFAVSCGSVRNAKLWHHLLLTHTRTVCGDNRLTIDVLHWHYVIAEVLGRGENNHSWPTRTCSVSSLSGSGHKVSRSNTGRPELRVIGGLLKQKSKERGSYCRISLLIKTRPI